MRKPKWFAENDALKRKGKKKKKPVYSSMQLVRQIRHWLPKNVKKVFDTESDLKLKDKEIKAKAKISGLTLKEYEEASEKLDRLTTGKLALFINLLEQDFLANCLDTLNKATQWAKEKKDYRFLLSIEREKMFMMKRLMDAGRIINPFSEKQVEEEEKVRPTVLPDLENL